MLANAETKWAVLAQFKALIDHIANGRLNETMACFGDDADVAMFGSEASDTAIGRDAIRTHFADIFARPYRILFDLEPGKISAHGAVAWLTAEGTFRLSTGDERHPYRLTAIFQRRGASWVLHTFSGSEPR